MDMHRLLKDLKERVTRLESALAQQGEESLARLAADDVITTAKFVKKQTRRGRKPAAPLSPLVREDLDRRLQEAPFSTAAAVDRQGMLAACAGVTLRLDFSDLDNGYHFNEALEHAVSLVRQAKANPLGCRIEVVQNGNSGYFADGLNERCGAVHKVIR
ncbi:MAG TPA: hypothetical protein PK440_07830 [Candidatus Accumulibacter phosphatis]|nr:MAG: hypothetical protein AW07_03124 [Candidatus Accumulibacter sp. SK-11]HRL76298.1 hypothetical protein [Candidatus Accumulibacter phosphatis]HRQ94894.1 hypothetical protein [Candidatus Accumulibacter phosphatis]